MTDDLEKFLDHMTSGRRHEPPPPKEEPKTIEALPEEPRQPVKYIRNIVLTICYIFFVPLLFAILWTSLVDRQLADLRIYILVAVLAFGILMIHMGHITFSRPTTKHRPIPAALALGFVLIVALMTPSILQGQTSIILIPLVMLVVLGTIWIYFADM